MKRTLHNKPKPHVLVLRGDKAKAGPQGGAMRPLDQARPADHEVPAHAQGHRQVHGARRRSSGYAEEGAGRDARRAEGVRRHDAGRPTAELRRKPQRSGPSALPGRR